MAVLKLKKKVDGAALYPITDEVLKILKKGLKEPHVNASGVLHLFNVHTSCALTINESWDPSAKADLECFLDHLAPASLPFIEHTLEGPDDSPAHMKTSLLNQHIALIVEQGELLLGQWQGIYLAEFRDQPHERTILIKYQPD